MCFLAEQQARMLCMVELDTHAHLYTHLTKHLPSPRSLQSRPLGKQGAYEGRWYPTLANALTKCGKIVCSSLPTSTGYQFPQSKITFVVYML